MRLTIAPYCAAISPAACVPAMPSACTVCSASSLQAARGAGGGREHADASRPNASPARCAPAPCTCRRAGRSRSPRRRRSRKSRPLMPAWHLGDRDQRRQHHRADVQHALAMHVVELEALHLRAVDQRGVRRGRAQRRAPDRRGAGRVRLGERRPQDAAPLEVARRRARSRAKSRISSLMRSTHLGRNPVVAERRDEIGDAAGVRIVRAGMVAHGKRSLVVDGEVTMGRPLRIVLRVRLHGLRSSRGRFRAPGSAGDRTFCPCRRRSQWLGQQQKLLPHLVAVERLLRCALEAVTDRLSARPSFSVTVTVEARVRRAWPRRRP